MSELAPSQHSGLGLNDLMFVLFKHKKLIVWCTLAGFLLAAAVYLFYPPVYESQAKLLVRYVLERSPIDPIESSGGSGKTTANILGSELEILTSWDLAVQVAEAVGINRLVPGGKATKEAAAAKVSSGLDVTVRGGSDIIFVSYKNQDPQLATLVLDELVNRYFNKHLEVHRSAGAFDFVTQQTDQVRTRLNQTEDALKALKEKAGIVSLTDSMTALTAEQAKIEDQLRTSEAEVAEQQARVKQIGKGGPDHGAPTPVGGEPTSADVQRYQSLVSRLSKLNDAKLDLLAKYTPANELVQRNQEQIEDLDRQRRDMDKKFPGIGASVPSASSQVMDLESEKARLAGTEAKREALQTRLQEVRRQIKDLSEIAPKVADLERQKELEETNYKYFEGTLEKARVDEALDPSKMPNISAVQRPSPPVMVTRLRDKIILGLLAGGAGLGLIISFLSEFVLNRTVKRSLELEAGLGAPLLISIPYANSKTNGHLRLPGSADGSGTTLDTVPAEKAPWDLGHFIRPYSEAIRDRLGLYFKLHGMTHKPKLVGVTGFTEGAGTSTLAAGLAAALSETGDGKVLLVDVNVGGGRVHPFFRGRPAYSLTAALQPSSSINSASDRLYLATVAPPSSGPMQLALKRFFDLMPNLKASDFDYIIFDMPPLTQTSPTLGMSGFLDKLLLVVEAEKNHRDLVKRGYAELVGSRANVSVVFNKTRSYAPKWLEDET